jgi:hypothetical protein
MIPLVSKILEVMDEKGLIVMPLKVNGMQVKVSPVAPLAMAQNMEEISNIMQFKQLAEAFGPEGQMALNNGETVDYIGDKLGVPATLRMSSIERQQAMAQQAQIAAAMAEQQGMVPAGATQVVEQASGEMEEGVM